MQLRDWKAGAAALSAASVFALAASPSIGAPKSATVVFKSQNGSGETGTAKLTALGSKTRVVLSLTGATGSQPAHIHAGTCATLNPAPKYPLTNVVGGSSTTIVPVPLAKLVAGTYAINVHKSVTKIAVYVACGNITGTAMGAMHGAMGGSMHGAMGGAMHGGAMHGGSSMGGGAMSGGSTGGAMGGSSNGGAMGGGSTGGAMGGGSTSGGSTGGSSTGGSMSGGAMHGGGSMSGSPAPSAPQTGASPQGPGSGGGTQAGPLATPAGSTGPASAASHSP